MPSTIRHPLRSLAIILFSFWIHSSAHAEIPTLGDPTIQYLDRASEARLGRVFYNSLKENINIVDDLLLEDYLESLATRIASHSDTQDQHFRFFLVESDSINAFAGPDGHIGVNTGLILETRNESQLAGVLAHEISHVTQRHIARAFATSGPTNAVSFATLLAAILISTQDPTAGQAVLATGIAGTQQYSINFTRYNEYEADRIGIELMERAEIAPEGMVEFFEILLAAGDGIDIEYLRTHPLSINRVGEARNRITDSGSDHPVDSEDFRFAKARIHALYDAGSNAEHHEIRDEVIDAYHQALMNMQSGELAVAISGLRSIRDKSKHPWIHLALADALSRNGDIEAAGSILKELNRYYPDYLPVSIAYASLLNTLGSAEKSIPVLLRQLQSQDDAIIHETLARAYFINGQVDAALESTGDQYIREGYTALALQQYENALQQSDLKTTARKRIETKKERLKEIRVGHDE